MAPAKMRPYGTPSLRFPGDLSLPALSDLTFPFVRLTHTLLPSTSKIFVTPVEQAYRIRTGESGEPR